MKIIKEISEMIEEELDGGCGYVKMALKYKEENRALADTFFVISQDEMKHMTMLHNEVVKLIDEHKRTKGELPEAMKAVYDFLHEKHIEAAGKVKALQDLYKAG